jgi:predicted dehydrogenase
MDRRQFVIGATGLVSASALSAPQSRTSEQLKVGILGVGMRGQVHLEELMHRADVVISAICDIDPFMIDRALKAVSVANRPKPEVYTGSKEAWRDMLAKAGLDAVFIFTPWELHAKVAVACEVVAGITLEDHWAVLRAQIATGTPYMLLENVCYRRDVLAVLNMARQEVFGQIEHLEGGYQHDLRDVKFNAGKPGEAYGGGVEFGDKGWSEAKWRTQHSIDRNGDLYPSHGIGPCAMQANINRGNRFERITSYATKARGLNNYVKAKAPEHPNTKVKFKLGDVVQTQIACAGGETILLSHDTSLPRPYSLGFRVQGTNGIWMDVNKSIYIQGQAKEEDRWEPAQPWLDRYDHPLWKKYGPKAQDSGHGGMDFFVVHAFIEALKRGEPMPIDIYDAVTWSAISPLSEMSVARGNKTLTFPDFTGGKWRSRKPIFALDDRY